MPTSIEAGRDQHLHVPGLEGVHDGVAVGRLQLTVHHGHAAVTERPGLQTLRLGHGRGRRDRLRLVDGRAHHVDLASSGDLLAHEVVAHLALTFVHETRDDRLATRRRPGDGGHVEVAVHGERQGARDRRSRHVQDVRRGAAALGAPHEGVALLHAEAVLLVDDQQRQAGELDVLLQQRVRADHEAGRAARDPLERGPPLLCAQRRGQQLGRGEHAGEPRRRLGVLHGKRLGRRHERALEAGLRRPHEAVERHDRLARAHVALQQPAHRDRAREVRVQLVERLKLVRGQFERQALQEGPAQVRRCGECGRRSAALLLALVEQQPHLHQQQLFEHEAGARDPGFVQVARQVHGHGGVRARRQPFAVAKRGGQRVGQPAHRRPHAAQEAAQQPRRHLLAGRVHRDDALGVDGVALLFLRGSRGSSRRTTSGRPAAGTCPAG